MKKNQVTMNVTVVYKGKKGKSLKWINKDNHFLHVIGLLQQLHNTSFLTQGQTK